MTRSALGGESPEGTATGTAGSTAAPRSAESKIGLTPSNAEGADAAMDGFQARHGEHTGVPA